MRIEKLNKDKIKVTLTTAELINLDIDVKRLSPDSKELHTFLFHIMETIREETGFNPYNGQVVVEATPSQDGISILVKRLNKGIKKITEEQFKKVVSVKPKKKESRNDSGFFLFRYTIYFLLHPLNYLLPNQCHRMSFFRWYMKHLL